MLLDFFRRRLFAACPPAASQLAKDEEAKVSSALEKARAETVLDFWRHGLDTFTIATRLKMSEVEVCRITQSARDRQRGRP